MRSLLVVLLVTFSGACSLVYQVVWDRSIRTNFGGDNVSSAIVSGTFLLGLGLGAVLFGRAWRRPFLTYALVEAAIGIFAMVSHGVLGSLAGALTTGLGTSIEDVEGLRMPLVAACIAFLLPPCILMGGSLPLMFRCFVTPATYRSSKIGWIYGFNTFGAALGTVVATVYLLSRFSVPETLTIVGAGNLLLAAAIALAPRLGFEAAAAPAAPAPPPAAPAAPPAEVAAPRSASLLAVSFATGFVTLAFEVSLFRHVFVVNPNSPYNFALVLAPFLVAIAAGSALFTRLRRDDPASCLRRIAWISVAAAAAMVGVVTGSVRFLETNYQVFLHPPDFVLDLAYCAALAFPLPFFLSAVFPLLLRIAARTSESLPRRTGPLYLANSAGAFAGAILAQFVGFPALGVQGVLVVLEVALCGIALWALLSAGRGSALAWALSATALVVVFVVHPGTTEAASYTFGRVHLELRKNPELLDHVEGSTGVATLKWGPLGQFAEVYVNGQFMSTLPDHADHIRLVGVAVSQRRLESVLVLGLGGGGMVRELLKDPRVRRIDAVDWSHELPRILDSPRARAALDGCLRDPRVRVWRADARVAVTLYPDDAFDLVIDNLTIPHWVGSTAIRSKRYFGEIQRLLRPTGAYLSNNHGFAETRAAVRAGLAQTFRSVRLHPASMIYASDSLDFLDPERAEVAVRERAEVLQVTGPPFRHYYLDNFPPLAPTDATQVEAIRDDWLVHEFRYRSIGELLRWWQLEIPPR